MSLALVLPSLFMAFNLDKSTRKLRMERWTEQGRLVRKGLGKWRRSLAKNTAKVDKGEKRTGKFAQFGAFRQWVGRLRDRSDASTTKHGLDEERGLPKTAGKSSNR